MSAHKSGKLYKPFPSVVVVASWTPFSSNKLTVTLAMPGSPASCMPSASKSSNTKSPKLAEAICTGKVFPKVEIHLTGPSEGSACQGTFYAYELRNVQITSYKVTGSNPLANALIAPTPDNILPYSGPFIVQAVDAPVEEVSLNFEEIKR